MINQPHQIFISYSYGSEDIVAESLEHILASKGYSLFEHNTLRDKLVCNVAGGRDLLDLKEKFLQAGIQWKQERSDPLLFQYLIEILAEQNIFLILWSKDYSAKFWTRVEWKTILAMCKRFLLIQLDNTPLPPALVNAAAATHLPVLRYPQDYSPSTFQTHIETLLQNDLNFGKCAGETSDSLTGDTFIKLLHPLLGTIEIGKYELTNTIIERFFPEHHERRNQFSCDDNQPAVFINWPEANEICRRMTAQSNAYTYRLPTEIEWEFAARAGELSYTGLPNRCTLSDYVVHAQNTTAPVGSKLPNAWGLYDCIGNVAEWTSDYGEFNIYNGWINPVLPRKYDNQLWGAYIVRGSYFKDRGSLRQSASYPFAEDSLRASEAIGMRIVRQPKIDTR